MKILCAFYPPLGPGYGFTSTTKKSEKGSLPRSLYIYYVCKKLSLHYDSSPVKLVDLS